jgi:toxin-antitoxin system PIN domain toxin
VKLLADVNVLVALAWPQHPHHAQARRWWAGLGKGDALATCAITELGFVRISLQMPGVATDLAGAQQALAHLRRARPGHVFLTDGVEAAALPAWVKTSRQTTDGHLAVLATAHSACLVTLDSGIPGAVML